MRASGSWRSRTTTIHEQAPRRRGRRPSRRFAARSRGATWRWNRTDPGGAVVVVRGVPLGCPYAQAEVWFGFQITFQYRTLTCTRISRTWIWRDRTGGA